jgi:hypothetical protein
MYVATALPGSNCRLIVPLAWEQCLLMVAIRRLHRAKRDERTTEVVMAKKNKIIAGLKDAVRFSRGDHTRGVSHTVYVPHPLDVRAIRQR